MNIREGPPMGGFSSWLQKGKAREMLNTTSFRCNWENRRDKRMVGGIYIVLNKGRRNI